MVEPERPQMMSQYGAYALHDGQATLHERTRIKTPRARAHARTRARTQKYVIFIVFSRQQLFANAPHCYIIRTLLVFFKK